MVQLVFKQFIIYCDLFLCVLFAPFEGSLSVSLLQGVYVSQFGGGWFNVVKYFLILVSDFSQNFLFFLFVSVVDNVSLVIEFGEGFVQSKKFIGRFFMEGFGLGDGAGLSFLDVGLDVFYNSPGILLIIIDFGEFFLFEISDILGGIFVDFFDVVFEEVVFGFFDGVVFDGFVSVKANGSISDAGSAAAHFRIDVTNKMQQNLKYFQPNLVLWEDFSDFFLVDFLDGNVFF